MLKYLVVSGRRAVTGALKMPKDIESISKKIAGTASVDGYSLWRMQTDLNSQIFALAKNNVPVPIELARLRASIAKARELRRGRNRAPGAVEWSRPPKIPAAQTAKTFDEFDFVDRYRALGGRRVAVDFGPAIQVKQWSKDTPEAEVFWMRSWTGFDQIRQCAVAWALLVRGRY